MVIKVFAILLRLLCLRFLEMYSKLSMYQPRCVFQYSIYQPKKSRLLDLTAKMCFPIFHLSTKKWGNTRFIRKKKKKHSIFPGKTCFSIIDLFAKNSFHRSIYRVIHQTCFEKFELSAKMRQEFTSLNPGKCFF